MNVTARREQIVEHMKLWKFDTASNLAFEFKVSRLTILRDIQELTVNGHPIQTEPGNGGGIRWVGGKRNFPFTEREITAIHNAIASAPADDKPVLENLVRDRTRLKVDTNRVFKMLEKKSQRAFAAGLGISESHLSRILSGQRKPSEALAKEMLQIKDN